MKAFGWTPQQLDQVPPYHRRFCLDFLDMMDLAAAERMRRAQSGKH